MREPASMSSMATQRQRSNMKLSRYSTTLGCADVRIMAISFCRAGRSVVLDSASFLTAARPQCPPQYQS